MTRNYVLFFVNAIMFIIRVLKLLPMQGKYVVIALIIILTGAAPVAGSTAKIGQSAPVYIGESNLDISAALNGCHTIGWWQEGANTSAPPQKNMTIYEMNTVSDKIYHFNISLESFAGYTGPWYCMDKQPRDVVFEVFEPRLDIRVWDLDHNQDVSGQSIPISTNITYRVDTNLYPALLVINRPNINPSDSFFTVVLTNPLGRVISTIYTGNAGNSKTHIISFEKQPFITASPYYWKNGKDWDHSARSSFGETLYPLGTYTFTINQDLNAIQETYITSGIGNLTGITTKTTSVTFIKDISQVTSMESQPAATPIPAKTTTPSQSGVGTPIPTSSPLPVKTTYAPIPVWIVLVGIIIAGILLVKNR
jgi:hypothetical protein